MSAPERCGLSNKPADVAVIIPTYNRGLAVLNVLKRIYDCDPVPAEVWVHIDGSDGRLEACLAHAFPDVRVLSSLTRLGPGGGRHRCLLACRAPFAVSFDDDSMPVDTDFFRTVRGLFNEYPEAAVLGASIWHRNERPIPKGDEVVADWSYVGCGVAMRIEAYRQIRGYLPEPLGYGVEEADVTFQLFRNGWRIYKAQQLRVFHDTDLIHHQTFEVTSASITNVGLNAFLHYPTIALGWGGLQVLNRIRFCIQMGRTKGIVTGLAAIPRACYKYRRYRNPLPWRRWRSLLLSKRRSK